MLLMRMKTVLFAILLLLAAGAASAQAAPAQPKELGKGVKAAFVRDGDLWIKAGSVEKRLTKGEFIRSPKWSYDGRWIAYTRGEKEQELWVNDVDKGENRQLSPEGGGRFEWAPRSNLIAYRTESRQLMLAYPAEPAKQAKLAERIGNFSWLPDGSGFLAASAAELQPDGWTPVRLLTIPLVHPDRPSTLYVLPKEANGLPIVDTSVFKWSADGRWIAFLAKPTASLSADSNTLSVLSADGATFKTVDQMAGNDRWFQWAASGDRLAYIGGVGREATTNKRLTVTAVPALQPAVYTPAGYVDQSFAWQGASTLLSSRAVEGAWSSDPAKRPFPFLNAIDLASGRQRQLTPPAPAYGDYDPTPLRASQLAWVRSDRIHSNVMLSRSDGRNPAVWIKGIDLGANYYEQWNWGSVLRFYTGE